MEGWKDGCMEGWMGEGGWMDEYICRYVGSVYDK